MIRQMSISETRKKITSLETELSHEDTISVTNHGKKVFALLRWDTYESIAETLELLADTEGFELLRKGIEQMNQNQLLEFDEFKTSLNVQA